MSSGIITFSFDDARFDSKRAIEIANSFGIKSTLNVTTAYVDGSRTELSKPTTLPAMSISDVKHLYEIGTEIACHGDEHNNDFQNIINGLRKLQNWFPEQKNFGFASPHSLIDLTDITLNQLKTNGIKYVRIGPYVGKVPLYIKIIRKIACIINSPKLLYYSYIFTIKNAIEKKYLIKSVSVLHCYTVEQMLYMAKKAIKNNKWCIFMFHSILDENEEGWNQNFSWPLTKYTEFVKKLSDMKNNVNFMNTMDAFNLLCARDN